MATTQERKEFDYEPDASVSSDTENLEDVLNDLSLDTSEIDTKIPTKGCQMDTINDETNNNNNNRKHNPFNQLLAETSIVDSETLCDSNNHSPSNYSNNDESSTVSSNEENKIPFSQINNSQSQYSNHKNQTSDNMQLSEINENLCKSPISDIDNYFDTKNKNNRNNNNNNNNNHSPTRNDKNNARVMQMAKQSPTKNNNATKYESPRKERNKEKIIHDTSNFDYLNSHESHHTRSHSYSECALNSHAINAITMQNETQNANENRNERENLKEKRHSSRHAHTPMENELRMKKMKKMKSDNKSRLHRSHTETDKYERNEKMATTRAHSQSVNYYQLKSNNKKQFDRREEMQNNDRNVRMKLSMSESPHIPKMKPFYKYNNNNKINEISESHCSMSGNSYTNSSCDDTTDASDCSIDNEQATNSYHNNNNNNNNNSNYNGMNDDDRYSKTMPSLERSKRKRKESKNGYNKNESKNTKPKSNKRRKKKDSSLIETQNIHPNAINSHYYTQQPSMSSHHYQHNDARYQYYGHAFGSGLGGCWGGIMGGICGGCGFFQGICCILLLVFMILVTCVWYLPELNNILEHFVRMKELEIEALKYDTEKTIHENQLNYDLKIPLNKKEAEYEHKKELQLLEAKKLLLQQFIDANTQIHVKTKGNLLSFFGIGETITETEKRTVFSEDDLRYFQSSLLAYTDPSKQLPYISAEAAAAFNEKLKQIAGEINMNFENDNDGDTTSNNINDNDINNNNNVNMDDIENGNNDNNGNNENEESIELENENYNNNNNNNNSNKENNDSGTCLDSTQTQTETEAETPERIDDFDSL